MNVFIRIFYNLGLVLISIVYSIKYVLRGRSFRDISQRFCMPKSLKTKLAKLDKPIWLHAVSVGEVNLLKTFIAELRVHMPNRDVVVSTITPTGYDLARKLFNDEPVLVFYFPLDFSFIVNKFISVIDPLAFIAMETEIWPNIYYQLNKIAIPVIIVNGRLSDKSYPSYKRFKGFFRGIFKFVTKIAVQSDEMQKRFIGIGATADQVVVSGNIKYQSSGPDSSKLAEFKKKWAFLFDNKIFLAGSTHEPEEKYVLDAYTFARKSQPGLRLIICPRHIERAGTIAKMLQKAGEDVVLFSEFKESETAIYVIDVIGQLKYFYSISDVAFVGGSMMSHGGQNILEPAFFAKPIIFGPNMQNFKEIANRFLENNAAVCVNDVNELSCVLCNILEGSEDYSQLGENAYEIINQESHALSDTVDLVVSNVK